MLYGFTASERGLLPLLSLLDAGILIWLRKPSQVKIYLQKFKLNYKNNLLSTDLNGCITLL